MQDPEQLKQMQAVKRKRMKCIAWLVGVPAVWAYFVLRNLEALVDLKPYSGELMILLFALGSYIIWVHWEYLRTTTPKMLKTQQQASAASVEAQTLQGEYAVCIAPEGVSISRSHVTHTWDWAGVRHVESSHEMIRIRTHTGSDVPIPHHALLGVIGPDELVRICRGYQGPHADVFVREEIKSLLAERDYPCPGCTYQLHGVQEPRCPECSRPIVASEIRHYIHQESLRGLS